MDESQMRIAYVLTDGEGGADRMLAAVCARAAVAGLRLAGTVQHPVADDAKCRIRLHLLPAGPECEVSLDLGPGSTACRLDAGALEEAALVVQGRVEGAQALIVNRFGKQEATGRGLVSAIGEACARGLPVVAAVAPVWLDAFRQFAGRDPVALPIDEAAVFDWLSQG